MIEKINFQKIKSLLKKFLIVIVFLSFSALTFGQKSVVDKLYDKYSGKKGITSVYISEFMFKLISAMDPDDKEFKDLVNELKGIKILSADDEYYDFFKKNIINQIPLNEYQELMVVKEEDDVIRILVKENKGKISELLIISDEGDDASLIVLQGNINIKSMSKLSKISGLEQLEDLELEGK